MSTPEGDRQPSQHGILFFPDKSFVSSHMKFQNFPAERSLSPYWENLVFGALVDEVWWAPPSHIRCRLWKRQVPSYQLPVTWLCSLVQIVKGQNMEKKPYFLEVRNCLLDCTSQTWVLWPRLTSSPPCKQAELVLSQVTRVHSTNK